MLTAVEMEQLETEQQTPQQTLADRTPEKPPAVCHACGRPKDVLLIVFFKLEKQQWCVRCILGWAPHE